MALLTDRASILREFFRLTDTDSADDDQTEHDATALEGVEVLLSEALLEAQDDMFRFGVGEFWLERSTAVLAWLGTDAATGGRSAVLPTTFRRAYGDEDDSCLVGADGNEWGREILPEHRHAHGPFYYFRGGRIWLTRGAQPPASGLYIEYYRRPNALENGTDADFPAEYRTLIPAHAAVMAVSRPWYDGDQLDQARLEKHLESRRARAFSMARPSRKRRRVRPKAMRGGQTHWWG